MRLKERLKKNTSHENITIEEKSNDFDFSFDDIFVIPQNIKETILNYAEEKRNIIFITNKSFDKHIIADYMKFQLKNTNAKIISEIDSSENLHERINILPNPDIQTIVKIMEQTLYGCESFIWGLSLNNFDNVLNKLKAVIALNFSNLQQEDINILIASTNAIIVYLSKNEDGLFYVIKIDEIKLQEKELKLNTILADNSNQNAITEQSTKYAETKEFEENDDYLIIEDEDEISNDKEVKNNDVNIKNNDIEQEKYTEINTENESYTKTEDENIKNNENEQIQDTEINEEDENNTKTEDENIKNNENEQIQDTEINTEDENNTKTEDENIKNDENEQIQDNKININNEDDINEYEQTEEIKKPNKYKLLREKIKLKKEKM